MYSRKALCATGRHGILLTSLVRYVSSTCRGPSSAVNRPAPRRLFLGGLARGCGRCVVADLARGAARDQEVEGLLEHRPLRSHVPWGAHGDAAPEAGEKGPRVEDSLRVGPQVHDGHGGDAQQLDLSCDQPDGLVAIGSNGDEQSGVGPFFCEAIGDGHGGLLADPPRVQGVARHDVDGLDEAPQDPLLDERR